MQLRRFGLAVACAAALAGPPAALIAQDEAPARPLTAEDRIAILRRSQVWSPVDVREMDLRTGPTGSGAFAPGETVTCDFVEHKFKGKSPKFQCALAKDDEIKVKYGQTNGEVFGEVAATRLLWALGFGADRMYPVRVICRGCPAKFHGAAGQTPDLSVFEFAAVERKAAGKMVETHDEEGWSWNELDVVDEAAGGAPTAHRDALKLLAVLMQHSDNKPIQQKMVCLDKAGLAPLCAHSFMMIDDLGLTFGRSDILDRQNLASVNFERWSQTPTWKKNEGCIGNLAKSLSGSMHDPVISEAGRKFLADLLAQLSDAQIHDLFDVARVDQRRFEKASLDQPYVTIDDWVSAFKKKRDEISSRHCG